MLRAELAQTPDVAELSAVAGVPVRRASAQLVEVLEAELWSSAQAA